MSTDFPPSSPAEPDFEAFTGEEVLSGARWFVSGMLVVLSVYLVVDLLDIANPKTQLITVFDLLLGAVLASLLWAIRQQKVLSRCAHPVLIVASLLGVADLCATVAVNQGGSDLRFVPFIAVAVGSFAMSPRWLLVFFVGVGAGTLPVAAHYLDASELSAYHWTLFVGLVSATAIHLMRRETHRRLFALRWRDNELARQLSEALQAVEMELEDHKQTEAQRRSLELQLAQAQKMEAVGQLAGGIAHDMNNILGSILLLGSALKELDDPNDPELPEIIDDIMEYARRGGAFTKNLLGFARKGAYRREPVDLVALTQDTVAMLRRTVPKTLQFETVDGPVLDVVEGDSSLLSQVLVNLCLNAIDAGAQRLQISLRCAQPGPQQIASHPHLRARRYLLWEVQDDGTGMSEDALAHAFDPFFTTKSKSKGTGLGLSMVYSTLRKHQGVVQLHSELGVGTRVSLWLPSQPIEPAAASTAEAASDGRCCAQGCRVLVVDDEPMARRAAALVLEQLGHQVLLAEHGQQAVALVEEQLASRGQPGAIDLVLLDMLMPVMDGHQTFARLRALDPGLRVIVCTGYADGADTQALVAQGAGLLAKPFEKRSLRQAISTIMGS